MKQISRIEKRRSKLLRKEDLAPAEQSELSMLEERLKLLRRSK